MKKIINLFAIFVVGTTSIFSTTNAVACEKIGDIVKLYELYLWKEPDQWGPYVNESFLIIEIDKTTIEKYTLDDDYHGEGFQSTKIIFFMKDKTINNFNASLWVGPPNEYEKYFIKELGIKPTPYKQWRVVWGYKPPNTGWTKNYQSSEAFCVNPEEIDKVLLEKIDDKVKITIEFLDGSIEERIQLTGNVFGYRQQFVFDLKINHENVITVKE